jgi:hypothetical protein
MYRYCLFGGDGGDAGEATYAVMIQPGEQILTGDGRKLLRLDFVPVLGDNSPFVGLLKVEPT